MGQGGPAGGVHEDDLPLFRQAGRFGQIEHRPTMEFGDDFSGSKVFSWNRYAVVNPVLEVTGSEAIVGDPMVVPPDSANLEWGVVYFSSSGESAMPG